MNTHKILRGWQLILYGLRLDQSGAGEEALVQNVALEYCQWFSTYWGNSSTKSSGVAGQESLKSS